jgi:hypothetical protein
LIVLPLLDVYRTYYGVRMAAYMFGVFFVTMVLSAIIMDRASRCCTWYRNPIRTPCTT